ncbi:hypothetical protein MLD38_025620 [Melastoma candidum]|uniref:Uncharacterized protein n=1 Tax=Melastoma candidum TaxID=119954 RepID=A0ACB9NXB1_9MYRT|nr:hypothetical protein MLD38_025620 [Melastoma candidum]
MVTSRLPLILFYLLLSAVRAAEDPNCFNVSWLYSVADVCLHNLRENGVDNQGRNRLEDKPYSGEESGQSVWVGDLKSWGIMEPSQEYFKRGNLDVFSGRGPCLSESVCRLNLTSDGSGPNHGWYCHYVEVTSTRLRKRCRKVLFEVDQWLSTDIPPFQLRALLDRCGATADRRLVGRGRGVTNA